MLLFLFYLPISIKKRKEIEIKRYLNIEYKNLNQLIREKNIIKAHDKAVELYKRYPKQSGIICIVLGDIYNGMNDQKKAEWFYREAIKIGPKEVFYYIKLSFFYRYRKQLESSIIILNACEKFAPLNPLLLDEYGECFFDLGEYKKAIKYWKKGYKYSKNINILLRIGKMYYVLKDPRSENFFNQYINKGGLKDEILRIKGYD